MAAHVASGACSGAKDGDVIASFAPAYHERDWIKFYLGNNMKPKVQGCKELSCPCKRKRS